MHSLATTALQQLQPNADDDTVDRLHYYYTVWLIGICALITSARQYVGRPIQCWVQPQFTQPMEEYIESYCWIQNTYWQPLHEQIPDDINTRHNRQITYYQWTPFILALEAAMFFAPSIIWHLLTCRTGVNMRNLIAEAKRLDAGDITNKKEALDHLAQNLEDMLHLQQMQPMPGVRYTKFGCWRKLEGSQCTVASLVVKILYTFNVLCQFFLLNALLHADNYRFYGLEVLLDLAQGRGWQESGNFPRVTLCDVEIKYMGSLNSYTFQCALMGNLFNEKIFIMLWLWYLVIAWITMCSLVVFARNSTHLHQRIFILHHLCVAMAKLDTYQVGSHAEHIYERFVREHLKCDGVFVLRKISAQVGDVVCMDLIERLFARFLHLSNRHYSSPQHKLLKQGQSSIDPSEDTTSPTVIALNMPKDYSSLMVE